MDRIKELNNDTIVDAIQLIEMAVDSSMEDFNLMQTIEHLSRMQIYFKRMDVSGLVDLRDILMDELEYRTNEGIGSQEKV